MEPVTLITTALVAGTSAMMNGALGEAGKHVFDGFKGRIKSLLAGDNHAELILAEHEQDPDTYEKPLIKMLEQAQVDKDDELIIKAQELMSILDQTGSTQGKYHVQIANSQGVQVGDHNHQKNQFGIR